MKKISTVTGKQSKNFPGEKLTNRFGSGRSIELV
jgi:hypothetical protein